MAETPCPKCGLPLADGARFCSRCGTSIAGPFAGASIGAPHDRRAGGFGAINPGSVLVVIGGILFAAGDFFQLYLIASLDVLKVNYVLDAEISDGLLGTGILLAVVGWAIHQVFVFRRLRAFG
ncbi:MAG: zinc ribbon domain-containing protein [Thermoplasmata archaeon]|nr:zinc ribbon domain-containing protein [Thermoplasmata archaeon]